MKPGQLQESYAGKTLLVVSNYDDKLELRHVGTMVFNNKSNTWPTEVWDINGEIESIAAGMINKAGRFNASVAASNEIRSSLSGVGIDFYHTKVWAVAERKEKIKNFAKRVNKDVIVLISPFDMTDQFFRTNQSFRGYGIVQRSSALSANQAVTFANMEMVVYDGTTGDELTWNSSYLSEPRDPANWMEGDLFLTDADAEATRVTVRKLLRALETELLAKANMVSP